MAKKIGDWHQSSCRQIESYVIAREGILYTFSLVALRKKKGIRLGHSMGHSKLI